MALNVGGNNRETTSDVDTVEAAGNVLCEFLEVAIHHVLYIRGIYRESVTGSSAVAPTGSSKRRSKYKRHPDLFERRRKYNVPVYMCVHPELNQYIRDVLVGVKGLLGRGLVDKLVVAIKNKEHATIEEFVMDIGQVNHQSLKDEVALSDLEQSFRAVLLTITTSEASLDPLPSECTFIVLVHTRSEASDIMEGHSSTTFPWVLADNQMQEQSSTTKTTPLKYFSNDILKMRVYVQEQSSQH